MLTHRLSLILLLTVACAPIEPAGDPCNDDSDCGGVEQCRDGLCEPRGGTVPPSERDAGGDPPRTDSGAPDPDAGDDPAGEDGGAPADAGLDAGGPGDVDAGHDAGPTVPSDAGPSLPDAGYDGGPPVVVDAGYDAGPPVVVDAGYDAGPPLVVDAGPPLPTSCAEVLALEPDSATGTYEIIVDDEKIDVFCEMDLFGGGWTQVVSLQASANGCPGDWVWEEAASACVRHNDDISRAEFSPPVSNYTEVAGRAAGAQFASTDSFVGTTLIGPYVDGLSLTLDDASAAPVHLWSFAVGLTDTPGVEDNNTCPCNEGSTDTAPAFVGTSYFCDSAATEYPEDVWFPEDLWDADATDGTCADASPADPRWFRVELASASSAAIGARLMCNQPRTNESVGVRELELYVR